MWWKAVVASRSLEPMMDVVCTWRGCMSLVLLYPAPPDLSQDQVNFDVDQMCVPNKPLIEDSVAPIATVA